MFPLQLGAWDGLRYFTVALLSLPYNYLPRSTNSRNMAESNELCITAAKPDGRGELTSAKLCAAENTQNARLRGFPFEGLKSAMQSALDKGIPNGNSSTGKSK